MRAALEQLGVPVAISDDAGGYVCNHVFYAARHAIDSRRLSTRLRLCPCSAVHRAGRLESTDRHRSSAARDTGRGRRVLHTGHHHGICFGDTGRTARKETARLDMDHGRFAFSPIVDRAPLKWPNGAYVAVWIAPNIEHFHFDEPFASGRPTTPGCTQLRGARLRQSRGHLAHDAHVRPLWHSRVGDAECRGVPVRTADHSRRQCARLGMARPWPHQQPAAGGHGCGDRRTHHQRDAAHDWGGERHTPEGLAWAWAAGERAHARPAQEIRPGTSPTGPTTTSPTLCAPNTATCTPSRTRWS